MCLDVIKIVSCLLGRRIAPRRRARTRKKDSWTADTWVDRAMEASYDEDLTENPFLQVLRQEYTHIFERAVREGLIVCVPRCGSFAKSALVEEDFLGHILVPEAEEESSTTRFRTLAGREVKVSNRVLAVEYDIAKPCSAHLLFEETFYVDENSKYSLWCIERPLEQSISASRDDVLAVTNLREALDLLWTEVLNKDIIREMTTAIEEFQENHEDLEDEPLHAQRDLVGGLYAKNLRMLLQDVRLREKTESNRHFLRTIKTAAETYTLHGMRALLPRAVAAQTSHEDAALNKTIKNLHDLQLRDLGVRGDVYDGILRGKLELSRLNAHSTVLGKTCCLRKALRYASEGTSLVSSDDILPVLIYLVIRAGMPNWIAQLSFMKQFRYSVNSTSESDEAGFLITSLEAAVEHVRSGVLSRQLSDSACTNDLKNNPKSSLNRKNEDITLSNLFSYIRAANQYEIEEILGRNVRRDSSCDETPKLCHPLCTCESCETRLARASFAHLPTVNSRDDRGMTAIHVGSLHGHANVVDYLLEQGADPNDADADGTTPLHCAASRGHQNTLLLLLHANADPRITDSRGNTPLHLAADHGHEGCVKALLYFTEQMGISMNKSPVNASGETPLHHAAKWGYGNIVQILVEHGADTRATNRRGQTPLVVAHSTRVSKLLENTTNGVSNGKVTRVESTRSSILRNGDRNFRPIVESFSRPRNNKSHKIDRLLAAIAENDLRLACYYLGLEGPLSRTPVDESPSLCHPLCNCERCATAPEDSDEHENDERAPSLALNARNSRHETALHAACEHGRTELVRILLDAGASINSITLEARTPLHLASSRGYLKVVKLLLDCGNCEVNVVDAYGDTPLHLAARNGSLGIVQMLIRYGADTNVRNSRGIVPLEEAEKRISNDIFAMQSFSSVVNVLKNCRAINTCDKKIE